MRARGDWRRNFSLQYICLSSPDVRSHIPNQEELMDPHNMQSSFPIAGYGYSKVDLHFSNLILVILIITKHFPSWGKVIPSCLAQRACWGFFGSVCYKPLAVGYLGYGLPAHPSIEPRQWQKYQLAVAGLSNAVHSSHGCRAACFHGPGTGAFVPCHMAFFLFAWFWLVFFFPLCLWEEDLLCSWS